MSETIREIRFQAWHKQEQKMYHVAILYPDIHTVLLQSGDTLFSCVLSEIELLQYTGLMDKHGKEIYEGDIVSYGIKGLNNIGSDKLEHKLYGSVEWMQGSCCWWLVDSHMGVGSVYEVIGNIYEHPELVSQ